MPGVDIEGVLQANQGLPFVDRILHREKYPFLDLDDKRTYRGDATKHRSVATHQMSHAPKEGGNPSGSWVVYPNVVFDPITEALKQLDPREAERYAKQTGQFIEFKSEAEAEEFAKGYKRVWKGTKLEGRRTMLSPLGPPPVP